MVFVQAAGEIASLGRIGYQEIGVAEFVSNVPDGHIGSDETSRVNDGPKSNLADTKGQCILRVRMNDGVHVRPGLINTGVNESFDGRLPAVANGLAFQIEFDEVAALDNF